MKMDDNTYWILFWVLLFVYLGTSTYFKEQTKQLAIKESLQIQKMRYNRDRYLQKSMSTVVNGYKGTQNRNN